MTPSGILATLPASLDWTVLFRSRILASFSDSVVRQMFYLPADLDLSGLEYVVLTSSGRFTVCGGKLTQMNGTALDVDIRAGNLTLAARHAARLAEVDVDGADCLAVGEKAPFPPVVLHLTVNDGAGCATAIFDREPSREHYELLAAAGVTYSGGEYRNGYFVARFEHSLPVHVEAGRLGGFARTAHCNEFFLRHGDIDRDLEIGLIRAAGDRIGAAAVRTVESAHRLAERACAETLAMTCEPPPGQEPYAYGDLVPLGFLMRALAGEHDGLREKLLAASEDRLWAFHSGRLITATDSALVLQGLDHPQSVDALERFSDGCGGYYPQLWAPERDRAHMAATDQTEHWRQADFATTCLVRALRTRAKLPERTPLSYVERNFETRAGLFFANPYLTDWCVAQALRGDFAAERLRRRLAGEILASANPDGSFGRFDVPLSTSFAILALAAAGYRGRRLLIAQLRLLESEEGDGSWPESRPFYSTLLMPAELRILAAFASDGREIRPGWIASDGRLFELTLYRDAHRIIGVSAAALALAEPSFPRTREPEYEIVEKSARYACLTHAAYVGRFALKPYVLRTGKAVAG